VVLALSNAPVGPTYHLAFAALALAVFGAIEFIPSRLCDDVIYQLAGRDTMS